MMKQRIAIPTIVAVAFARTALPAAADYPGTQTISASGGTYYATGTDMTGYAASMTLPKSNAPATTTIALLGGPGALPGVGLPSSGASIYAVIIVLNPPLAAALTTVGLTKYTLTVPSTVSTSKPLYLYWSNLSNAYLSTPPPVSWSAAIAGSRSGNVATFSIPNFSIAAGSNSLLHVMQ